MQRRVECSGPVRLHNPRPSAARAPDTAPARAQQAEGAAAVGARPPLTQHHPQHVGLHHTHDVLGVLAGQGPHSVRVGPRVAAGAAGTAGDVHLEAHGGAAGGMPDAGCKCPRCCRGGRHGRQAGRQAARVALLAQRERCPAGAVARSQHSPGSCRAGGDSPAGSPQMGRSTRAAASGGEGAEQHPLDPQVDSAQLVPCKVGEARHVSVARHVRPDAVHRGRRAAAGPPLLGSERAQFFDRRRDGVACRRESRAGGPELGPSVLEQPALVSITGSGAGLGAAGSMTCLYGQQAQDRAAQGLRAPATCSLQLRSCCLAVTHRGASAVGPPSRAQITTLSPACRLIKKM